MRVTFATRQLVAAYNKNATIVRARGAAGAIGEGALKNAALVANRAAAEVEAYSNVSAATHVAPAELMQYAWWDQAMRLVGAGGELSAPLRTASMGRAGELFPQVRVGWTKRG